MSFLFSKDHQRIGWVTLNRPQVHNAFNDELIVKLTDHLKRLAEDNELRFLVIQGTGPSFCAGADLNWMKQANGQSDEASLEEAQQLHELLETLNTFPAPVLGKVHGTALGGGIGLVSCCDYVMAEEDVSFGFSEVRLGLLPAVISPYVIDKIGISAARAYFTSGKRFKANTALRMGLIHESVVKGKLNQEFERLVGEYLLTAPLAGRKSKELTFKNRPPTSLRQQTAEMITKARKSTEGQEGMSALLEKRPPFWLPKK